MFCDLRCHRRLFILLLIVVSGLGGIGLGIELAQSPAVSAAVAPAPAGGADVAPAAGYDPAPQYGGQCCYNPWQVYRGVGCYIADSGSKDMMIRWGPDRQDRYQDMATGEMLDDPEVVDCGG